MTDDGRIKWFNPDKRYGFIERGGEKDVVFLHISEWKGLDTPQERQHVTFKVEKTPKGFQAVDARPAEERPREPGDFLNPYNFVRPVSGARPEKHEKNVLGDAPPPPHDRYVDEMLTGQLTCKVTAVTPLFVSDSHEIKGKSGEHRSFRFFEYDGEPALPASSLRGMVRSVFEAVTNSCFAVFDAERRLQYREVPRYGNRVKGNPGIVRKMAEPDTDGRPAIDGVIELCQAAQVGAYYEGRERWKNALGRKPNGSPWRTDDLAVARAKRSEQRWLVQEIAETKEGLNPLEPDEEYIEGWLKITGRGEDTNKRNEALFLDPALHGSEGKITFSHDVQDNYDAVLKRQHEMEETPVNLPSDRLRKGDLVWVDVQNGTSRARRVARVQIPRVPYRRAVGELLPKHLHPCSEYEELCPACRVFGWVRQIERGEEISPKKRTAYAGRVRLTHGELQEECGNFNATLAILSSPKPTNTQFYLLKNGQPDGRVDYDSPGAQLRGRKVYRHHGDHPSTYAGGEYEYTRVNDVNDVQNRSVRGVLDNGAIFKFDLEFENLHPLELGALLWSLKLGENMHHRLGYGKPLGFGSVKIEITDLRTLEPTERYGPSFGDGWHERKEDKDLWIAMFIRAMRSLYGEAFDDVLKEMHALLSEPPLEAIHYPRTTNVPTEEGENFKWFVGNTRKHGPHITLALAHQDEGLPVMDERGRIQR
ncbi:MAG: TIGR03986 family CRISPR-associated RAMP protein [Chloroflexota bacterium]|nr:TIGR03986 family CRISPR-associated RAMP protein [Chloroflexota bacterium]